MQISAFGLITVYPTRGEMNLSITRNEAEGDGLLDPSRKRRLPRHPRVIAVVTSLDGAALHDIIAVVRRRTAGVRVVAVGAAVQGENAREEICYAIDQVNRWGQADLVIVGRGGGAHEDLSAFNDERVARAVAGCVVPTISAVGHEIDISICDLVADFRAPTPSAAAEAATRTRAELQSELRDLSSRMTAAASSLVRGGEEITRRLGRDLATSAATHVAHRHGSVKQLAARLHALSPLATLARGYAIARSESGATLSSASAFHSEMPFDLVVRDGVVSARVERVERSA
jgi:exodeoxyribonuclease VII large subunit